MFSVDKQFFVSGGKIYAAITDEGRRIESGRGGREGAATARTSGVWFSVGSPETGFFLERGQR